MEPITYTINLAPLEEGGFSVTVPALPGCVTWGTTFDHAVNMAREAIELWLEELSEPPLTVDPKRDIMEP